MKNSVLAVIFLFSCISMGFGQEISYGLKGGVNYPMGGQISGNVQENIGTPEPPEFSETSSIYEGQSKIGFHFGAFVQANFGKFFVRPEIAYTSLKTEFDFPGYTSTYSIEKFDIPFLIGYNIYGPVDVFMGPMYSNILTTNLTEWEDPDGKEVVAQNSPLNFQIGFNVDIGKRFGIDVRYERTLSPAENQALRSGWDPEGITGIDEANFDDARLHQIIVGVYFKLGGPGLNNNRRGCY